jgi:hypothetical protein
VDATRGFGFQHDGSLGQLEHFFTGQVFVQALQPVPLPNGLMAPPNPFGIPLIDPNTGGLSTDGLALRHNLVAFLYAYDSNMAPVVGQQITLTRRTSSTANPRIDLLEARATAGECDLVAKGRVFGTDGGLLYTNGAWQTNLSSLPPVSDALLRTLPQWDDQLAITFTCVPPGSGMRIALDRDGDGYADGDELLRGTNPADPNSHP